MNGVQSALSADVAALMEAAKKAANFMDTSPKGEIPWRQWGYGEGGELYNDLKLHRNNLLTALEAL